LVATPSPGSIFALLAMIPKGKYLAVLAGVAVSTVVSFLLASIFVKRANDKLDGTELEVAREKVKELKGTGTAVKKSIKKVVFACDAGMGSSAMGATTLRNKFKKAGLNIEVVNTAIENIPSDAEIVITHESLTERARSKAPNAEHISIQNFMSSPEYDELVKRLS
jgi:mannitol PTS system EIICBA or EIICB component